MQDLNYIMDEKERIIKVVNEDGDYAIINWNSDSLDIPFCNLVIMIACSSRGVGDNG